MSRKIKYTEEMLLSLHARYDGNLNKMAEHLGVCYNSLWLACKRCGIKSSQKDKMVSNKAKVRAMKAEGMSLIEIARITGIKYATVRNYVIND